MFCPQCAAEYRDNFTWCSDCNVALVAQVITPTKRLNGTPRDSIWLFFLLTIGLTWGFSALAFSGPGSSWIPFLFVLSLVASFGPSIVAVALTARQDGLRGVKKLLRPILVWRVNLRWYAFAVLYAPAIAVAAGVISGPLHWASLPAVLAFAIRVPVMASEEIGWRGFALPRLAARFGLRKASLLLGLLWAAWHLPGFWTALWSGYGTSPLTYLLLVPALSVVFAWLYLRTNRSLLLVTVFHFAFVASGTLLPSPAQPGTVNFRSEFAVWLYLSLVWLTAVFCLRQMRSNPDGFVGSVGLERPVNLSSHIS